MFKAQVETRPHNVVRPAWLANTRLCFQDFFLFARSVIAVTDFSFGPSLPGNYDIRSGPGGGHGTETR